MKNSRYFFNNILKLEEEYGESYIDLIEPEYISVGKVDEVLSWMKEHMPKNYAFAEKDSDFTTLEDIYLSICQYNQIDDEIILIPELCKELSLIKDCEKFFESETEIDGLEYLNFDTQDSLEDFVYYYSSALFVSELAVDYKPMEDCLEKLFNEEL